MSTKPAHPGDMYARASEHCAELKAKYPTQFEGPFISCSWPDGWHRLVREVCAFTAAHHPHVKWSQIKEKFGGLRLYYAGGPLRVDMQLREGGVYTFTVDPEDGERRTIPGLQKMIMDAEKASLETCVLCGGANGTPAQVRSFRGWWLASCETCEPKIADYYRLHSLDGDV